jgi:hypothetical protein
MAQPRTPGDPDDPRPPAGGQQRPAGGQRRPARASGDDARRAAEEETRSTVAAVRDLLARSLMLPADRIRETFDDAVRRGRLTRDDAEDLIERLIAVGRRQSEEAAARLEAVAGMSGKARGAFGRLPGTDRVLREVDRLRRSAGLGGAFPIARYDELTAAQVVARLGELSPAELRAVADHERRNANRKSVLAAVERRLR